MSVMKGCPLPVSTDPLYPYLASPKLTCCPYMGFIVWLRTPAIPGSATSTTRQLRPGHRKQRVRGGNREEGRRGECGGERVRLLRPGQRKQRVRG